MVVDDLLDGELTRRIEKKLIDADDDLNSKKYDMVDKSLFVSMAVSQKNTIRETFSCDIVTEIPTHIKYDGNSTVPVNLFVRDGQNPALSNITLGFLFSKIFKKSFTLVGEIHQTHEKLSTSLATMRNRLPKEYEELRSMFKKITWGIEVLVKQNSDNKEQILFVEGTRECHIENSASGHYALTNILYLLLSKPSGLIAIDEP